MASARRNFEETVLAMNVNFFALRSSVESASATFANCHLRVGPASSS